MENKQTAVEWLFDKITQNKDIRWRGTQYLELFEQAKAMEKEQIIDAQIEGFGGYSEISAESDRKVAIEYYNETYGKQQ